jgi:hypothetical protein
MSHQTVVVFLGPSLSREEARQILPEAIYLPPARRTDVASALQQYRPTAIGLIDGAFDQSLAVGHKEILRALTAGVAVLGAASMGAIRAAELDAFGMRGIGRIYDLYARGIIVDDDEVCVAHASADQGFVPLTVPLVNLRGMLDGAQILTIAERAQVFELARSLHYAERTWPALLSAARAAGLDAHVLERLSELAASAVDLKADDARSLLAALRDGHTHAAAPAPAAAQSVSFQSLWENDRRIARGEVQLSLRSTVAYAAVHEPDFDRHNTAALDRALVGVLAQLLHVTASGRDRAAEAAAFRRQRDLDTAASFTSWLVSNDLDEQEFERLMGEIAVSRRLHRWLLASDAGVQHSRWLLDELRLSGRYEAVVAAAAFPQRVMQVWYPEFEVSGTQAGLDLEDLAQAHQHATGWRPDRPVEDWAELAGFAEPEDLAIELVRAALVRERARATAQLVLEVLAGEEAPPQPPPM